MNNKIYDTVIFEERLKEIVEYSCGSGLKYLMDKNITPTELSRDKEIYKSFIIKCKDGFKKSQHLIIDVLLELQAEKNNLKSIKNHKERKLNKGKLEFFERLVKHSADSIVWQLLNGQLWRVRRFYRDDNNFSSLLNSNYKSVVKVMEQYNSEPENFVLLTDITNNIKVGDLIGHVNGEFFVAEVKEGDYNRKILDILHGTNNQDEMFKLLLESDKPESTIKHVKRILNQHRTLSETKSILRNEEGFDSSIGMTVKIKSPTIPMEFYTFKFSEWERNLQTRVFSYDIIDDCLHVGFYRGDMRNVGKNILETIGGENVVIIDYLSVVNSLNKPIYFMNVSIPLLFDIVFSRVKVFMMLDLNKFIDLLNFFEIKSSWGTKKETAEIRKSKGNGIVCRDNKGIKMIVNETEIWLSYSLLTRMFFENQTPSSLVKTINDFV